MGGITVMKTAQELYNERRTRLATAMKIGKPDRIPVSLNYNAFAAQHKGITLAEYVRNPVLAHEIMMQTAEELGPDGLMMISGMVPKIFGAMWLSKVKSPGVELGDNELWQINEQELMTTEDYDFILNNGWGPFLMTYCKERLDLDLTKMQMGGPEDEIDCIKRGFVPMGKGAPGTTPYEALCGGRSMARFMQDIYRMPDKVQAVMDVILEDTLNGIRNFSGAKIPTEGLSYTTGGWRIASQFLSPKLWNRFAWPYFKKIVETLVEEGNDIIFLHMDSDWTRDLAYFRELPKGVCTFGGDSSTDIYKVKEILGDRMAVYGDVPPALLALGTPDEVYNKSMQLIKDLGPSGYVLSSGCDVPGNAKFENVKAMVAAATGK